MSEPTQRSPLKVIRLRCLNCVGFEPSRVRSCDFTWCALHPYRFGRGPKTWPATSGKRYSARQAIKRHCLWCCLDSHHEVRLCPADDCPSWKWRLGTPAEFKRTVTPEQREKMAENLKKARSHVEQTANAVGVGSQHTDQPLGEKTSVGSHSIK